ncbi:YfhO family protein [Asanoa sp. NPDC049518]|uniref:YfhO family protein n=1 Tax=unclassified Asanoa TaxID=2685164 RepID=UPI0034175413
MLAVVVFAVVGIGTPLLGLATFANTDLLADNSPYISAAEPGPVKNDIANDVVASVLPSTSLFASELKDGRIAAWNPYVAGGGTLGSTPNFALLSPLTLPTYVLPAPVAPAFVKLLEILVAAGGTYLFLRRLRLGRAAAWLGGLAFSSSAFMIVWTNWPQTRVAAFIPAVFWATERLVTERRVRDGALLAAALAAMLFGGFPAVTGYTVLTAGGYLLARALSRGRALAPVLGAAGALVGAVMITAIQLLPFADAMRHAKLSGRGQTGADHLDPTALITSWAPWSLGRVNDFVLEPNAVESLSYIGAAGLVLFLVAVALPAPARAFLPRAVWTYLVAATAGWLLLIYVGGLPLAALQKLPVLFADNFVGRSRAVLGFLVAALVAVGFEIVLRKAKATLGATDPDGVVAAGGGRRAWTVGVGVLGLVFVALTLFGGWRAVSGPDSGLSTLGFVVRCAAGLAIIGVTGLALWVLWRLGSRAAEGRRRALIVAAAAVVPLLLLGQALTTVNAYWPRPDKDTWYPQTDVHRFLAANLGHERFAAADRGMYPGADSEAKLRSLTGEAFFESRFAETVQGLPGELFGSTLLRLPATPEMVRSPVLDRLSVRYFVTTPWEKIFGTERVDAGDGSTVTLEPGRPVSVPLAVQGPIRGVGITWPDKLPERSRVDVSIRDGRGTELAKNSRVLLDSDPEADTPSYIALAGDGIAAGTPLTAVFTVATAAPVTLAASGGRPAVSTVVPGDDGLELAYAGNSTVWERTTALPRIRWASEVYVGPDLASRMSALTGTTLRRDHVVLDGPPAVAPDGKPASVTVTEDGTDDIEARVDARGAGYLVVADALQSGWGVTVDGAPATLVPADNGLVAVAVPAGTHTVRLGYRVPMHNVGAWISGAALIVLLGIWVGVLLRRRRSSA